MIALLYDWANNMVHFYWRVGYFLAFLLHKFLILVHSWNIKFILFTFLYVRPHFPSKNHVHIISLIKKVTALYMEDIVNFFFERQKDIVNYEYDFPDKEIVHVEEKKVNVQKWTIKKNWNTKEKNIIEETARRRRASARADEEAESWKAVERSTWWSSTKSTIQGPLFDLTVSSWDSCQKWSSSLFFSYINITKNMILW